MPSFNWMAQPVHRSQASASCSRRRTAAAVQEPTLPPPHKRRKSFDLAVLSSKRLSADAVHGGGGHDDVESTNSTAWERLPLTAGPSAAERDLLSRAPQDQRIFPEGCKTSSPWMLDTDGSSPPREAQPRWLLSSEGTHTGSTAGLSPLRATRPHADERSPTLFELQEEEEGPPFLLGHGSRTPQLLFRQLAAPQEPLLLGVVPRDESAHHALSFFVQPTQQSETPQPRRIAQNAFAPSPLQRQLASRGMVFSQLPALRDPVFQIHDDTAAQPFAGDPPGSSFGGGFRGGGFRGGGFFGGGFRDDDSFDAQGVDFEEYGIAIDSVDDSAVPHSPFRLTAGRQEPAGAATQQPFSLQRLSSSRRTSPPHASGLHTFQLPESHRAASGCKPADDDDDGSAYSTRPSFLMGDRRRMQHDIGPMSAAAPSQASALGQSLQAGTSHEHDLEEASSTGLCFLSASTHEEPLDSNLYPFAPPAADHCASPFLERVAPPEPPAGLLPQEEAAPAAGGGAGTIMEDHARHASASQAGASMDAGTSPGHAEEVSASSVAGR